MPTKWAKFIKLYDVPDIAIPYIHMFVTESQMALVEALDGKEMTAAEMAVTLNIPEEEALLQMEDAYFKSVLNKSKEDDKVYVPADFYEKLDYNCKFENNYFDIPKDIRDALDQWCYDEYKVKLAPFLHQVMKGEPTEREAEAFLLLDELDTYLAKSEKFRVVPCNCRNLKKECERPIETCIRTDKTINDRTFGREITREEAKEIILNADKKGLMHKVNVNWREKGPKGMCNCCACCCYPMRLAEDPDINSKGKWPKVENVACYDDSTCIHCGLCANRCYYEVFSVGNVDVEINGKRRKKTIYNPDNCWGCGLCANTCPTKSITMKKLEA